MATKKDLVEAHSFSRRRLVTAFVSGAPGGREVEPAQPGRTIVAGLALAVLLVAVGAVLGIVASPTTYDWEQEGLVSEKESGADYLVLSGPDGETELRSLANITSAMLLFGADVTSTEVERDEIAERSEGAPIGILDAPQTPPEASMLVQTGWTACTTAAGDAAPAGIHLDVADEPGVTPTPDVSFVVRTVSGGLYLVAESFVGAERDTPRAYAYPVPDSAATDRLLQSVAATSAEFAVAVPEQWITLFPPGGALTLQGFGLRVGELDEPWPKRRSIAGLGAAEVGDVLQVGDDAYVLTSRAALKLDEFSRAVYESLPTRRMDPLRQFTSTQGPSGTVPNVSSLPTLRWPTITRTDRQPTGGLCALLDTPGGEPGVVLAAAAPGSGAAADESDAADAHDDPDITVESGHGAFVLVGDWDSNGQAGLALIDARGYRYEVGPGVERVNLGYGSVPDVIVPDAWVELLRIGVPLTVDAARCPPTSDPDSSCAS